MSTSKHIDKICCIILAVTLIMTLLFINADRLGIRSASAAVSTAGYTSRIFNPDKVHAIDIVMDDWDSFIENCTDEEYVDCTVIIDGEAFRNVAIRAKGNTSLSSVQEYGNDRYSFKIEFDHYDSAFSYYGLDKLCLNNIIQDNTYMKDYLTYRLMYEFGVDAPLCSYTYITVNGEDWGLYLAVEGIEESFLKRNYGSDYGQLYKPDSTGMGGGRGNGRNFDMEDFGPESEASASAPDNKTAPGGQEQIERTGDDRIPHFDPASENPPDQARNFGFDDSFRNGMKSSDVSLIYTDDEYESYSNIFDNAKANPSDSDKTRLIESLKKLNNVDDIENTVDIDEVIRYFVVHNFVLNFDSYTGSLIHNYYLYEKDGQLSMIPWDYNLAFGGFGSGSDATGLVNFPIDTPVSDGTIDSRPMLAWIFSSAEYTDLYHQYFEEFLAQYFGGGYFESMIDTVSDMIDPYVQKDPTKFCTYEEFEKGVSTLRSFCLLRAESVDGQLTGTIPSTSDGQAQDVSSLIDAGSLVVSDMGDMGNKMGRGGMRGSSHGHEAPADSEGSPGIDDPDGFEPPSDFDGPDGFRPPSGFDDPDSFGPPPDKVP